MDQVARAVLILQMTDSALMLSLVIATRLAPILLLGLIAGAITDRADKRRLLLLTQCATAASYAILGTLIVSGRIEVWHVFVTAVIAGTANAFSQPVRQSLIPATVPREDVLNAVALRSSAVSFMRIGGGSIAGLLLIPFDVGGVYLINAGIYLAVIATTVMMQFPPVEQPGRVRGSIFGDLREGISYVARNADLRIVVALAGILYVLGLPYQQVFVPLLAIRTLDMGDSGVGFLAGASGAGAFTGSLVVAWKSDVERPGLQLMINMLIFGSALVAVSLQATLIATALLLATAGAMTVTYMTFTNGILLTHAPEEMHGRVMSLLSLDRGLIPLGSIMAGTLASTLGVRPGLFLMGAAVIVTSGTILTFAGRRLAAIRRTPVEPPAIAAADRQAREPSGMLADQP